MVKSVNSEYQLLAERLNKYFEKSNPRIHDIRLDRVKLTLKDARYFLLNLSIDSHNYHSDLKIDLEESDEEIFNQIVESLEKFIKKLDNKEKTSKKK